MPTSSQNTTTVELAELDTAMQSRVEQVRESGSPVMITEAGEPAAVLVGAEQFSRQQFRLQLMDRIARARRDYAEGRSYSEGQADALIDEWAEKVG